MGDDQSPLPWGNFQQVKFGPGVIGKAAPVSVAAILLLFAAIYFLGDHPYMVFSLAVMAIFLALAFLALAFWYGHKHPEFSVLEGGELVRYREMELAAKDPKIVDITPEGQANTSPPKSIGHRGAADA